MISFLREDFSPFLHFSPLRFPLEDDIMYDRFLRISITTGPALMISLPCPSTFRQTKLDASRRRHDALGLQLFMPLA